MKVPKPKVNQQENPLFTNGDDYHMNACVGDNGGPYELFHYGQGFFEGGHAIVRGASEHVAPVDILVYPAAFSYRHAIELFLKQLVITISSALRKPEDFARNHRMIELWQHVAKLIEADNADLFESKSVTRAGELISFFDQFDPTGQVFRYPEDIKGNRHLAQHRLINVVVLGDQMKELQDIFETWYYMAVEYEQLRFEVGGMDG